MLNLHQERTINFCTFYERWGNIKKVKRKNTLCLKHISVIINLSSIVIKAH